MADRSKKRRRRPERRPRPEAAAPVPDPEPAAKPEKRVRASRAERDERPPAPWGSFPLVEIIVLIALVMLVVGFFSGGSRGPTLIVTGLVLGSLAGLELSIREHFAGFRSHTLLLAAAAGLAVLALLYFGFPDLVAPGPRIAIAAGVAVAAWIALLRAFRARSGQSIKLR